MAQLRDILPKGTREKMFMAVELCQLEKMANRKKKSEVHSTWIEEAKEVTQEQWEHLARQAGGEMVRS